MVESFIFNIATSVLGKLGSLAVQEVALVWGVTSELERLQDTLTAIRAVLLDAEEQQAKNHELRLWLDRLIDVCHDVDDVLDDIEIASLRRRVIQGSFRKQVRNFFSDSNVVAFRIKMAHKIKDIRERLDKIADDKAKFGLRERDEDRSTARRESETHSFLPTSDVIGRGEDLEKIVNLVMDRKDCPEGVGVIPIVGIGGLGKTTLAKMVYNDKRVIGHFDLLLWVCVSDEFNVKKLLVRIIKLVKETSCEDFTMEQLQACLRETLKDKRFLLVLDDVWNDNRVKWEELSGLLNCGADGNKIIVTTRSKAVAKVVGTAPSHSLKGLPYEDCVALFVRWAFKKGEELLHDNLMKIGGKIVRKCKGVPLAVRTLGSLLYMKREERDWLYVRDNEIWKLNQKEDDILPVLRLSYNHLPSYLKQCFAYCSVFPKDLEIVSHELIYQWIAQGLIQPSEQTQELEKIGEQYIFELQSRSFFQDIVDYESHSKFKMHDLVHDLALLVAQTEYLHLGGFQVQNISKKIRHLSFYGIDPEFPGSLLELKNVRTIYLQFDVARPSRSFVDGCASRFRCLRMLDLRYSCFEELPSSIGNLKHLRLLELSFNETINALPRALCKLQSLQTLGLAGCVKLENLPKYFGDLISLRCLYLTTHEKCLWEKGLGKLTSIRYLAFDECGHLGGLYHNKEFGLQHMTFLQTLDIRNCQSLVSLPQELRYLVRLEVLSIRNCQKLEIKTDNNQNSGGTQATGLKSLRYLGLFELPNLVVLPLWLLQGAATLKRMDLEDCNKLTTIKLPGDLKSVHILRIIGCPRLTSLPAEMTFFNKLNELTIEECPELIRRCQPETGEDWHKISHVSNIYLDDVGICK